ncbi:MAG: ABC transporter permease [Desulfuromonadales bacterium]
MKLETIAFNNIRRRKGRMAFLLAGLLLGIGTVVTLVSLSRSLTAEAQHKLENFGANILITPRSDQLSLSYGGVSLGGVTVEAEEIRQDDLALLKTIPNARNIAAVAPKLLGSARVGAERVLLMGVDPELEFALKRWWSVKGEPLKKDDEVVAGSNVARRLDLQVGDRIELYGRQFTVSGILEQTGGQDDHLLLAPLGVVQHLLQKPGMISLVEVAALCGDCPVEDMVRQISAVMPEVEVNALQQIVKTRMHALEQFELFSWLVAAVVLLVGALVVFVTMMGAVNERTREIGIFRALGFRRSHVMRLILVESASVSLVAGILGYLAGTAASRAVLPFFREGQGAHGAHGEHMELILWSPELAVGAVVLAVVVGCLASFYPALHASRMDPNEALRAL